MILSCGRNGIVVNVAGAERRWILDVPVDDVDLDQALERVDGWLDEPEAGLRHVVTVNPEFIVAAGRHDRFLRVLRQADLSTGDGIGVILAGRLLNQPMRERVTGVDLVQGIATIPGARIFLLGAGPGIAGQAAEELRRQGAVAEFAGCFSGDPSGAGWPEIERRLSETEPNVLLVAFGHPKQDLWIDFHREALESRGILVAIGVGGAFDYISGHVPRAPSLIRRAGLEWLYRLIRQPWRWRRQLALPVFAIRVIVAKVRESGERRAS